MMSAPSISLRLSPPVGPIGHLEALIMGSLCEKTPWGCFSTDHCGSGVSGCEAAQRSFMWSWRKELCHWSESLVSSGPERVIPSPQIYLAPEVGYCHRLQETPLFFTPVPHPSPSTPVLVFFSSPVCSLEAFVPRVQSTHLPARPAPFSTMGGLISALPGSCQAERQHESNRRKGKTRQ